MKRALSILLLLLIISGCRDRRNTLVPYVPVNITIDTGLPSFFPLTVPSGWVYITGGSRGIIIYRKSQSEFVAIERHSTYEVEKQCAVNVLSDGIILDDPCSDSQWLIMDGTIVNGPANSPLLLYQTSYNPPYLSISN